MIRPSIDAAKKLERKYLMIDNLRIKSEVFFTNGEVTKKEINILYESFFLKSQVEFEQFLETLFFGLFINGKGLESTRKSVAPKINIDSYKLAREVIHSSKSYLDWLPYERTSARSNLFFNNGKPFSELDTSETQLINKSHIIRNVIAHRSDHSIKKFHKTVIGTTPIPRGEKNPGAYLRGIFRTTPTPQTRFELHLAALKQIAFKLAR